MAQSQVKETDIAILIAAIRSSVGPIQVDAEEVAKHLGMSLSSIPPKFTAIRKRYNIDIKVVNSGALQRNRQNSPKKRLSTSGPRVVRCVNPSPQSNDTAGLGLRQELCFGSNVAQVQSKDWFSCNALGDVDGMLRPTFDAKNLEIKIVLINVICAFNDAGFGGNSGQKLVPEEKQK